MVKNKKNNSVLIFWHKVILDKRIYKIAIKFREKIKMPINGINSQKESDAWKKEITKNKIEIKIIKETINSFIKEIKNIIPYENIIDEIIFNDLLFKFFYFNEVDEDELSNYSNSGGRVVTMKDGVYLKINPFSNISNILDYVNNNKSLIRKLLKNYIKDKKLKKPTRIKSSSNFKRDKMILDLDDSSKKELEEDFNMKSSYKEILISTLMTKMGYKGVTSDVVNAVKRRSKLKK